MEKESLADPAAKIAVAGSTAVFAGYTFSEWLGLIGGALTVIYMLMQVALLLPKFRGWWANLRGKVDVAKT
ncbi:hypothetical protein FACS1894205_6070 [Alphaproteobacteria bacterium]|nr:hypothetical protein FACS1894205_6070 [Alphaproteobacteria bacterium]